MLISLRMPPRDVLQGIWNKTLRTYPEQHTLAFLKTLTSDNFPGIGDVEARPIDPEAGKYLLELGYAFLNHNPPRSNENLDTQLLMPPPRSMMTATKCLLTRINTTFSDPTGVNTEYRQISSMVASP